MSGSFERGQQRENQRFSIANSRKTIQRFIFQAERIGGVAMILVTQQLPVLAAAETQFQQAFGDNQTQLSQGQEYRAIAQQQKQNFRAEKRGARVAAGIISKSDMQKSILYGEGGQPRSGLIREAHGNTSTKPSILRRQNERAAEFTRSHTKQIIKKSTEQSATFLKTVITKLSYEIPKEEASILKTLESVRYQLRNDFASLDQKDQAAALNTIIDTVEKTVPNDQKIYKQYESQALEILNTYLPDQKNLILDALELAAIVGMTYYILKDAPRVTESLRKKVVLTLTAAAILITACGTPLRPGSASAELIPTANPIFTAEAQTLTIDLGNKTFDGLQPVDFGTTKLTKVDVLPEWVKDPTGKKLLTLRPIINRTLDVNTQLAFGTQPFRQADTNLIIDVPFMLQKLGNNAPDVEGLFPDMSAPPGPKSVFFAERFTGNNLIVQADKVGIEQTPAGYIFSIIHSDGTITYLVNPDEQKQSAPIAVSNVVNAIFKISDSVPSVATSTERKPAAPTPDQINFFIANGKAPSSLVIEKINQGVRLVAIGETHKELPEELEASKILKILQDVSSQGLINFLALEIDDTLQKDVDAYQQSGVLSDAMRNILLDHNAGYVELLKAAHTNKIQVLCVDNHNVENRDEYMNQKLLGFLQENPAYRGIFYVGDLHVTKYLNSLSDGLGGEYYAIWQTDGGDTVYNSAIAAGFTQPVAIEVNGSPFATVLWSTNLAWSSYGNLTDAIIVDPSK